MLSVFNLNTFYLVAALLITLSYGCESSATMEERVSVDTIRPVIYLNGPAVDTVLLQVSSTTLLTNGANSMTWMPGNSFHEYVDDAVAVLDEVNGEMRCMCYPITTKGFVNNKMEGVYTLTYTTVDPSGNLSLPLIRKISVVKSDVTYLEGDYEVECTNADVVEKSDKPFISMSHYTVHLSPSTTKKSQFDLSHLQVGSRFVKPFTIPVYGTKLEVDFYDRDLNTATNASTGTLSPSTCGFTIETTTHLYSPLTKCYSKNVFKKINTKL